MATMVPTKKTYQILEDLKVEVEVQNNPYDFQLDQLFQMATRINKKRSFLFVSKVLGKHLAVNPHIPLLVGNLLAMRYIEVVYGYKDSRAEGVARAIQTNQNTDLVVALLKEEPILLPKPTTFIGFAETATALGHAVFSSFGNNAKYIHTTREQINELSSIINFEEEHSHATSHRVYAKEHNFFEDDNEVVLIDDEITTGKTAVNIIETIKTNYPMKTKFTVVSILDWRTHEYRERYEQLEKALDITINTVSLIDGMINVEGMPNLRPEELVTPQTVNQQVSFISVNKQLGDSILNPVTSVNANGTANLSNYIFATGRFGLSIEEDECFSKTLETLANQLKQQRKGNKSLVIGIGEFMHVPMKVAAQMGPDVYFQSTTRSPIYRADSESYTIQNKFIFESPENLGVTNYLYNIKQNQYDEIFVIAERLTSMDSINSLLEQLKSTEIPFVHIVPLTEIIE